jgi:PrtD family type I secretion system ABC transporter
VEASVKTTLGRHLRRPLRWTLLLSVAINLLVLAPSIYMLQVFDRVLVSRSHDTLIVLLAGTGLALLMLWMLDSLRARLQALFGQMIGDTLMPVVTERLIDGVSRNLPGAATAIGDVGRVRQLFSANGLLALFDAPWLLIYVGIIALAHPLLGITAAVAAFIMLVLAITNSLLTRRRLEQAQAEAAGANRWLESAMRNAEVSHALGLAGALLGRWAKQSATLADNQRPAIRRASVMAAAARTLRQAVQVAMLTVGGWLVIEQLASPGVMVATTILLGRALAPVEQIVGSWPVLVEGRTAWRRLKELLEASGDEVERVRLPAPQGGLSVQNVMYRPPNSDAFALAGVSLEVAPGESLAIVGRSGSGKSTLARILVGVWRPTSGIVRLDGVDLTQWPRADLGPSIGYLPQDIQLFAGTVAENIARLGEIDSAKVLRAAQRAGVHEMILALPEGYETRVDPNGGLVSPGQRQRIALARALYGDPKLVVLDEPNANLDGDGEISLTEALKSLRGEVTVITVTHRTNLVQHMDRMVVMEAGRVRLAGPVTEVMNALAGQGARPGGAQVVAIPRAATGNL